MEQMVPPPESGGAAGASGLSPATLSWWAGRGVRAQRSLALCLRVGVFAVVAVSVLGAQGVIPRDRAWETAALSVAALTIVLWTASDWWTAARAKLWPVLPWFAGAMALLCGLASLASTGGPLSLLSSIAMSWLGVALSLAVAGTIAAAGAVAIATVGLVYGVGTWGVLGYPLILLVALAFGRLLRGYRAHAEQSAALLASAEELREEHTRAAALEERNRIAREIHDVLAHSLGALSVQIQVARAVLTDRGDVERAVELLNQAQRMATDGLTETRRALRALHSDTPPLAEGLAELGAAHQQRHRASVSFAVSGTPRPLSPDAGLALTRTAQEALVNTAKHAPKQPVEMRLEFTDHRTALTVANRLPGPEPPAPGPAGEGILQTANGGYGLGGMRERLRLIEGTLEAGPEKGRWVVSAEVPQ